MSYFGKFLKKWCRINKEIKVLREFRFFRKSDNTSK